MSQTHHLTLSGASQAWDLIADQVDALITAWESTGQPPDIGRLLPEGPPALRRLVLVELIKCDLEYRWGKGGWWLTGGDEPEARDEKTHIPQSPVASPHPTSLGAFRKTLDDYLAEFSELAGEGALPCDLIFEEFHIRRQCEDQIDLDEYCQRFPEHAAELRRLAGAHHPLGTTSLFRGGRVPLPEVGQRIDDFELLALLGKGAFASVYMATQRSLQRLVALKVSAHRGDEPQTLAQLDHAHIVRVHDQRILPGERLLLLYMEIVPGGTLGDVISRLKATPREAWSGGVLLECVDAALVRFGQTPPANAGERQWLAEATWGEVVCWLGARLALALDYAHGKGVLHRDVKPANTLLSPQGAPKLVDFNVSYCSGVEGTTPAAFFGGSLAYMSPEQLEAYDPRSPRRPEELDGRSDIYSLGVVLWELLTGARPLGDEPFDADWSAMLDQMTARRRRLDPVALSQGAPADLPEGLAETIGVCLAPDPDSRWPVGRDLAGELELCLRPGARRLVRDVGRGWRGVVVRYPILAILAATLPANLLGAIFNYYYNRAAIIQTIPQQRTQDLFWNTQMVINSLAFPLGILWIVFLALPIARGLRAKGAGEIPQGARIRALRMGRYIAWIDLTEWMLAGLAYPVTLQLLRIDVTAEQYLHFLSSMAICGLIASAYPYFGATYLAARAVFPALLKMGPAGRSEAVELAKINRYSNLFLAVAAAAPMLGVGLLTVIESNNRLALGALSAAGVAGFGLAFWWYRAIGRDVALLMDVMESRREA